MLRLLKKYTFGYHINGEKNSERVPTRSIVLSSYPGALSSQDEYYGLYQEDIKNLMVLAGTPLTLSKDSQADLESKIHEDDIHSNRPVSMSVNKQCYFITIQFKIFPRIEFF